MGMYGKEIIFNKLPALLPKLCIIIMLEEVREKFAKIEITMKLPKTKPQVFNRQVPPHIGLKSDFNFIFCLSPFKVEEAGDAIFDRTQNLVIASNAEAVSAAKMAVRDEPATWAPLTRDRCPSR